MRFESKQPESHWHLESNLANKANSIKQNLSCVNVVFVAPRRLPRFMFHQSRFDARNFLWPVSLKRFILDKNRNDLQNKIQKTNIFGLPSAISTDNWCSSATSNIPSQKPSLLRWNGFNFTWLTRNRERTWTHSQGSQAQMSSTSWNTIWCSRCFSKLAWCVEIDEVAKTKRNNEWIFAFSGPLFSSQLIDETRVKMHLFIPGFWQLLLVNDSNYGPLNTNESCFLKCWSFRPEFYTATQP